jgi:hypothetical protein
MACLVAAIEQLGHWFHGNEGSPLPRFGSHAQAVRGHRLVSRSTEIKFRYVPVQMLAADIVESSMDAAFEPREG